MEHIWLMTNSELIITVTVTQMECIDQPGLCHICTFCLRMELISPESSIKSVKEYDSLKGCLGATTRRGNKH